MIGKNNVRIIFLVHIRTDRYIKSHPAGQSAQLPNVKMYTVLSAIGFYAKLMLYSQLRCATQHPLCVGEKRKSHLPERWSVNHSTLSRIGIYQVEK